MAKLSPMMEQYFSIKKDYEDCLLFFRLGDFYEMFYDDAKLASKELELALTGRDCGTEEKAAMCGVPYHSADAYVAKLIQKGYKVAICEQIEDPKASKGIVKREVVRVITSGTVTDTAVLEEGKNNFILSIYDSGKSYGLGVCDVSTGQFGTTSLDRDEKLLIDEVARINPSEIIINHSFDLSYQLESIFDIKPHVYNEWCFEFSNAYMTLLNHFKVLNLYGFGMEDKKPEVCASGGLLSYLIDTQKNNLNHIINVKPYTNSQYMVLDVSSRRNLEITENVRERSKKGSLLWVLDSTKTAMGKRLLRSWLSQPLININEINLRLDAVEELKNEPLNREEINEYLGTVYDLERLIGKFTYQNANARDLVSLKKSFANLPFIKAVLGQSESGMLKEMYNNFDTLEDIYLYIDSSICDEPPFSIREGGFIKRGFNKELDSYHEAKDGGTNWLLEYEREEREKTGIKNLKIKYNKIFGYCLEVTNSYKDLAPDYFVRRQTLAGCERYTTEHLKEIEDKIMGAGDKINELEYRLFQDIREFVVEHAERIREVSDCLAVLDCIQSYADAADKRGYVKPEMTGNGSIKIKSGRHPVIEAMNEASFIPNDTYLNLKEDRLAIITGPNMAGKSTYMRQVAIIVLMAQAGSFVPAEVAEIGVVDRIFTRVGASDDLATGQSTFMVEMSEVANILNNATKNSLLILDEIGRGTSTYDGLSIAWAVMEHIADEAKIGAKTLFATHYHELTELEGKVPGIKNYCISVSESDDGIIFLRKIQRGGAKASYGIQVAKLAGVPEDIIERSEEILSALNAVDISKQNQKNNTDTVYYERKKLDKNKNRIIINEILELDVNNITPFQALATLAEIKEKLRNLK